MKGEKERERERKRERERGEKREFYLFLNSSRIRY
jgi:hypothetical protein